MSDLRREVGFLKAVKMTGLRSFMLPEGLIALLMAGLATGLMCSLAAVSDRMDLALSALRIVAPLLGVVLAALTFVISFASDDYLRNLKSKSGGVLAFYRPFVFALGIEIIALILIIVYRALATHVIVGVECLVFAVMCFFVAYSVFNVLAVARNVVMHALLRAELLDDDPKS